MIADGRRELRWKSRPKRERTIVAERTIWETADGRFRVVRSQSLFGLPTVFYSLGRGLAGEWAILGRHRKRRPAFERCRKNSAPQNLQRRPGGVT